MAKYNQSYIMEKFWLKCWYLAPYMNLILIIAPASTELIYSWIIFPWKHFNIVPKLCLKNTFEITAKSGREQWLNVIMTEIHIRNTSSIWLDCSSFDHPKLLMFYHLYIIYVHVISHAWLLMTWWPKAHFTNNFSIRYKFDGNFV